MVQSCYNEGWAFIMMPGTLWHTKKTLLQWCYDSLIFTHSSSLHLLASTHIFPSEFAYTINLARERICFLAENLTFNMAFPDILVRVRDAVGVLFPLLEPDVSGRKWVLWLWLPPLASSFQNHPEIQWIHSMNLKLRTEEDRIQLDFRSFKNVD